MGSSASFPLEEWLLEEAGYSPFFFDAGWNASTFGVAIAHFLGCNPITTIGVDHTYSLEKPYAFGLENAANLRHEERCKGEWTRRDFKQADRWLEEFKKAHPEIKWGDFSEQKVERLDLPFPFSGKGESQLPPLIKSALAIFSESHLALQEIEMITHPLYNLLFEPLWEVWESLIPFSPKEESLHRLLFFKKVLTAYDAALSA